MQRLRNRLSHRPRNPKTVVKRRCRLCLQHMSLRVECVAEWRVADNDRRMQLRLLGRWLPRRIGERGWRRATVPVVLA